MLIQVANVRAKNVLPHGTVYLSILAPSINNSNLKKKLEFWNIGWLKSLSTVLIIIWDMHPCTRFMFLSLQKIEIFQNGYWVSHNTLGFASILSQQDSLIWSQILSGVPSFTPNPRCISCNDTRLRNHFPHLRVHLFHHFYTTPDKMVLHYIVCYSTLCTLKTYLYGILPECFKCNHDKIIMVNFVFCWPSGQNCIHEPPEVIPKIEEFSCYVLRQRFQIKH